MGDRVFLTIWIDTADFVETFRAGYGQMCGPFERSWMSFIDGPPPRMYTPGDCGEGRSHQDQVRSPHPPRICQHLGRWHLPDFGRPAMKISHLLLTFGLLGGVLPAPRTACAQIEI